MSKLSILSKSGGGYPEIDKVLDSLDKMDIGHWTNKKLNNEQIKKIYRKLL